MARQTAKRWLQAALVGGIATLAAPCAGADTRPLLGYYGMPGLLDMPSGLAMPDAEIGMSIAGFHGNLRQTLSFQITPRLTGSFRYSVIERVELGKPRRYDRSFDLHYQLLDEKGWLPAVAIGARDFIGTGIYSGEYLAATKTFGPKLSFTGGIGWGRLGSYGSFENPLTVFNDGFGTRPVTYVEGQDTGGLASLSQLFRGPAALFGGVHWQPTDRVGVIAEYASDNYDIETAAAVFDKKSPFNFGVQYAVKPGLVLGASYMYGSEIGVSLNILTNPKRPKNGGDHGPAPVPVRPRSGPATGWTTAWVTDDAAQAVLRQGIAQVLQADGLIVERIELTGDTVRIRYRNDRYNAAPQAMGHIARALSLLMPPSVENFVLEPSVEGMTPIRLRLKRRDIEALENDPDGTAQSLARAQFDDPGYAPGFGTKPAGVAKPFTWNIGPYISTELFDPDNPLRADLGAALATRLDLARGLSISGVAQQKVIGNKDTSTRTSNSILPHVRSDANLYAKNDGPTLERLTLDYFTRPGRNLYARLSFGYLEPMFAGVSAEVLWKRIDSRLALGAEMNYVTQREFDKGFGLQDYSVATGHVSAYYDFGRGFDARIDVGRYLAGDVGATFALDRTFDNGWKMGAYFTLTDVSFAEFGEGAFDKGIHFVVPLSWISGVPNQRKLEAVIQPITRDGGARLAIANRLYEDVRGVHAPELSDQWARFWR